MLFERGRTDRAPASPKRRSEGTGGGHRLARGLACVCLIPRAQRASSFEPLQPAPGSQQRVLERRAGLSIEGWRLPASLLSIAAPPRLSPRAEGRFAEARYGFDPLPPHAGHVTHIWLPGLSGFGAHQPLRAPQWPHGMD